VSPNGFAPSFAPSSGPKTSGAPAFPEAPSSRLSALRAAYQHHRKMYELAMQISDAEQQEQQQLTAGMQCEATLSRRDSFEMELDGLRTHPDGQHKQGDSSRVEPKTRYVENAAKKSPVSRADEISPGFSTMSESEKSANAEQASARPPEEWPEDDMDEVSESLSSVSQQSTKRKPGSKEETQALQKREWKRFGAGWRKYGQKQVKGKKGGVPITRSYYKCTFAGCPVKKIVEKALWQEDSEVDVTVFGEHSHEREEPSGEKPEVDQIRSRVLPLDTWRWQDYNPSPQRQGKEVQPDYSDWPKLPIPSIDYGLMERPAPRASLSCDAASPHVIVWVSEAFVEMTGYAAHELQGCCPSILQGPDTDQDVVLRLRNLIKHNKPVREVLLNYRKDRTPFWNYMQIKPQISKEGKVQCWHSVSIDISATEELKYEVEEVQEVEALTRQLEGWKVLVVDDDKPTRMVLERQLCKAGASVTPLKDGQELLDLVRQDPLAAEKYNVCILDEMMPEVNGSAALKALREEHFGVKTVLMSGTVSPMEGKLRFRIAGADTTIQKPIRMDPLMNILKRLESGIRSPIGNFVVGTNRREPGQARQVRQEREEVYHKPPAPEVVEHPEVAFARLKQA